MHEYQLTGRALTDKCLKLANKAHNYYFNNPLKYVVEFSTAAKDFFAAIDEKFYIRTGEQNIKDAIEKHFAGNNSKIQSISTELWGIKSRLDVIISHPNLVNEKTLFVLDHTARFIEIILPFVCDVKEEVEHHKKFTYDNIINKELKFFVNIESENYSDNYLQGFLDNSWRAQKNITSFNFIKDHLNLNDPEVKKFYKTYGGFDYSSSLIFSRMANEQFLKYLTKKHPIFWEHIKYCLDKKLSDITKNRVVAEKKVEDKAIHIPNRIDALTKAGVINKLIAIEAKLVNARGNNIAHHSNATVYSSCYHNLELLNYFNKYCK